MARKQSKQSKQSKQRRSLKVEYVLISADKPTGVLFCASLWGGLVFLGAPLATTKYYFTKASAVRAAKVTFRRTWDKDGRVTGYL